MSCLIYLYRSLLCLGLLDQARLQRDQAIGHARRLSPYTLTYALCLAWYGNWALEGEKSASTMLSASEEILEISGEQGFSLWLGIGNVMRGWCLSALGQAEGISLLLQGLAICRDQGCKILVPYWLTILADVYGKSSQPNAGLDRLAEAANLIETTQERWTEAEMHRVRGTLLQSMDQHAAAEVSLKQALAVARRQSAKFWELRAALDLARLWRDQGKRDQARDLLAPVYNWFTEGFDTPVLKDAKALLEQLTA